MPRFPGLDPSVSRLGGSVFSSLASRIASLEGEVYPLHVGDTWLEPDPRLLWTALDEHGPDRPHRYCDPHGHGPLLDALVDKVRNRNRIPVEGLESVLVTTGATGALGAAALSTVSSGDEVLLLAPYWPLIPGIVVNAHGVPVEVPVLTGELSADVVRGELTERVSGRTAAVYVSTPSNPTGRLLPGALLEVIAEFARAHDLWIWSDEVYEDYAYTDDHASIGAIAPERTLSVFSFSKAYGLAGYRCGYLAGPSAVMAAARRAATYVWYSAPTPSQLVAVRALADGAEWVERARHAYREVGNLAADRLGVARPDGGAFLFVDVGQRLDGRGLVGFLEDCLEDNLILAPGVSFGASYTTWLRLCFTCAPPEVVARGVERLAARIGAPS